MSSSPRLRRLSNASNGSYMGPPAMDGLVNYYEAEQERIINLLSRKLGQLRVEKIQLENALEAESESQVNRLNRELTALRRQHQQPQPPNGSAGPSTPSKQAGSSSSNAYDPNLPTTDVLLDVLRSENESLRNRLVDIERDYLRAKRLNEVYREELIEHRTKAHLPIDNLIDPDAAANNEMPHRSARRRPPSSRGSPSSAILTLPPTAQRVASAPIPMPRAPGSGSAYPQHHPRHSRILSSNTTSTSSSLTHSPVSTDSPYTFSPPTEGPFNPASYVSNATNLTTPPSSISLQSNPPLPYPNPPPQHLSYPSVPPPSLSSSLGSPTIPFLGTTPSTTTMLPQPDAFDLNQPLQSSLLPHHRQNSLTTRPRGFSSARVAETGSLRELGESRERSRRESLDNWSNTGYGVGSNAVAGPSGSNGIVNRSGSRSPAYHSRHTSGTFGELGMPSPTAATGASTSGTAPIPIRVPHASRESTPVNK